MKAVTSAINRATGRTRSAVLARCASSPSIQTSMPSASGSDVYKRQAGAIYFAMDENEVRRIFQHECCMVGSDGLPLSLIHI